MLDQGVDRNRKEPCREAEGREQDQDVCKREIRGGEYNPERCQPVRTKGTRSEFDLAARRVTGREATEADAARDCSRKNPGAGGSGVQPVFAIKDDIRRQRCAKKPEIRVAKNCEPQ